MRRHKYPATDVNIIDNHIIDLDRWAEERQYLRHDTAKALTALRTRRAESLHFLHRLTPEQWQRGSIHVTLGRMTYGDWVALVAGHDDNHLGSSIAPFKATARSTQK